MRHQLASRGIASYNEPDHKPPPKSALATNFVQGFRRLLARAFDEKDIESNEKLSRCTGVYAFFDFDGEPIYVGQTSENFATRIGRHLRGQRSDTIAYRILDPLEVASMQLWPVHFAIDSTPTERRAHLDAIEYSAYVDAIRNSRYNAILNEKIPPLSPITELPNSYHFNLIPPEMRDEREHPDLRIARRAETLARVAAVAHERGEVSNGLRRVIVIQAVRLADLAAARLAYAEGRSRPSPDAINVVELVGNVLGGNPDDEDV